MSLVVLSLAQFLVALDYSIVYVALPSIGRELHLDPALAQWVISAYAVLFAGFLMVGGRLADRYGRLFVVAVSAFGATSAIAGFASDGAVLLAARGAQGLAAALLQPAVLALLGASFAAGPARNRALAVWGSVGASGLAAGAILGGVLTTASWRWTFLINVPLTVIAALCALRFVPVSSSSRSAARPPLLGSALGTGAVLSLVVGLTVASWPFFVAALLLGAAFVRNEVVSSGVLIPRALRRIGSLRLGAGAAALYMASVGSEFYLVTLLLQDQRGYRPLAAGLAFLPLAVLVTAGSTAAGRLVRAIPAAVVLAGGFAVAAAGLGWLVLGIDGSYAAGLLPGLLISGFGHGVIYTSMFIIGTRDVPDAHQGAAGSLLTTAQYVSGAVTVAVLTLVLDGPGFRWAFGLTAAAAAAGVVLSFGNCRTRSAGWAAWQLTRRCASNRGTTAASTSSAAPTSRR